MKWIKAEDLLAARFHLEKDYPKITPPGVDPEVYMRGWNDALEAAADRAEVEPVKRGRWIYDNQFHWYRASCSECGYKRVTDIKAEKWNDWHYCPNCGAKMEPISASPENGREQRRSPDASL